jgi:hypothetical protein
VADVSDMLFFSSRRKKSLRSVFSLLHEFMIGVY